MHSAHAHASRSPLPPAGEAGNIVYEHEELYNEAGAEITVPLKLSSTLERQVCGKKFPKCASFDPIDGDCTVDDLILLSRFVQKYGTHVVRKALAGGARLFRVVFNRNAPAFQDALMRSGGELDLFIRSIISMWERLRAEGDEVTATSKVTELSYSMSDGHAKSGYAERLSESREELRALEDALGIVPISETFIGGQSMEASPSAHKDLRKWLSSIPEFSAITSVRAPRRAPRHSPAPHLNSPAPPGPFRACPTPHLLLPHVRGPPHTARGGSVTCCLRSAVAVSAGQAHCGSKVRRPKEAEDVQGGACTHQ